MLHTCRKTEITIDNQHVTKSLQSDIFLPKQPKENTEKIKNLMIFLDLDGLYYVVSFFRKNDLHLIIRYDQDLPTWMSFFIRMPFTQ